MKKFLFVAMAAAALLITGTVTAQEKGKWAEKDAFHEVMSKTFHPAEEGKFEPIKARAGEMLEKAIAWKKSKAPAGYDKQKVKTELGELVKGVKKLNKLIQQNGADAELKTQLTALHDIFHTITEKCEDENH